MVEWKHWLALCHAERVMRTTQKSPDDLAQGERLMLGIDTCGNRGSVALGLLNGQAFEVVEQIELEGRSYSATLVSAVGDLLVHAGASVADLGAIVAVNGPGSFTGVRVGLSAVKGLAEATEIPVVAVSRLEVLASKAQVDSSALDAHRHEIYLRLGGTGAASREFLVGGGELNAMDLAGTQIAVCDDAAAGLLGGAGVELIRTEAPTAADALLLCASRVAQGDFVDLALLDGHYLRRSDAEIFAAEIPGRTTPGGTSGAESA
jgi:tRNA threonylcarbamoyladenosine biosynthesis protein TsaB